MLSVAAVVFVLSAASAWGAWRSREQVAARVADARQQLAAARARADSAPPRRGAQGLFARAIASAEAPPPSVLAALGDILPADVRLQGLTVRYGDRIELDMDVSARDPAAYDLFLQRLQDSPLVEGVVPGDENRQGEVRTSVRAVLKRVSP